MTRPSIEAPGEGGGADLRILDAARGLAALYVVAHHASQLLWEDAAARATRAGEAVGPLRDLLASAVANGQPAVLLFFVISGFCIHYRQAQTLVAARAAGGPPRFPLGLRTFYWRRARRLYPPFLAALALTAALDAVGAATNPEFHAGATGHAHIDHWVGRDRAPGTLAGNLLMQASLAVPAFGTNIALWSLAYEFWFYALYPGLLLLTLRGGPRVMLGIVGLISAGALVLGRLLDSLPAALAWVPSVLGCWVVWAAGAFLAEAYAGRVGVRWLRWAVPPALGGLFFLAATTGVQVSVTFRSVAYGLVLAILLGGVLLGLPAGARRGASGAAQRLAFLGGISYSVYLVHQPWLALLAAWWLARADRLPLGPELVATGILSAVALGAGMWYLVERHFTSPGVKVGRARISGATATA